MTAVLIAAWAVLCLAGFYGAGRAFQRGQRRLGWVRRGLALTLTVVGFAFLVWPALR